MKFDIVFSNPPYSTTNNIGVDRRIISSILPQTKNAIIIFPMTNYLSFEGSDVCEKFKQLSLSRLKKICYFNGNSLFKIGLFVPIGITYFSENKNDKIEIDDSIDNEKFYISNFNELTVHGKKYFDYNLEKFFNRFLNLSDNIISHRISLKEFKETNFDTTDKFFHKTAIIRGNVDNTFTVLHQDDFYSIVGKDYKCHFNVDQKRFHPRNDKECTVVKFDTENERMNYHNYLQTKVIRFILTLNKISGNMGGLTLKMIPWMDFTQHWDDKKLCKEFEIDNDLWNYINNFIPDYYDDYNSGFNK